MSGREGKETGKRRVRNMEARKSRGADEELGKRTEVLKQSQRSKDEMERRPRGPSWLAITWTVVSKAAGAQRQRKESNVLGRSGR